VLTAFSCLLKVRESYFIVPKEGHLLMHKDASELSMQSKVNGISKSLLHLLGKHTEYHGKKFIGRSGPIYLYSHAHSARILFSYIN